MTNIADLDAVDRKILRELDTDCRQSDAAIARKVRVSREVCRYRIKRLEERGVIKDYVTILNHHALGVLATRLYIKTRDMSEDKEEAIIDYLRGHAMWAVRVRGNYSYNVMLLTTSVHRLEEYVRGLKERFAENIISTHFSLVTRIYHYRRGYYTGAERGYELMGEVAEPVELDETDRKVLEAIQTGARKNTVDIAREIDESERVVRYRLKKLEDDKVVLGYRALPDTDLLGLSYYKVHFTLNDYSKQLRKKLEAYAEEHENVVYLTDAVGGWDVELEYQVSSSKELYAAIDEFTELFSEAISDYEFMEYDKEYYLSYLNTV